MKALGFALTAVATALATAPALAAPVRSTETERTSIEIADIDYTSVQGQRELERRIDQAANEVCRRYGGDTGSWVPADVFRDCKLGLQQQVQVRIAERAREQQRAEAASAGRVASAR